MSPDAMKKQPESEQRRRGQSLKHAVRGLFGGSRPAAVQAESSRFEATVERLRQHPRYDEKRSPLAPYGLFHGRPIIGEQSPVCGGIYLSLEPREAIVVDERYGRLREAYTQLMVRYIRIHGQLQSGASEHQLIREVIGFCKDRLCYVPDDGIAGVVGHKEPDHKVALDLYLECARGTDRHQILLAAYFIEKLIAKKVIEGKVFLDSRHRAGRPTPERLIYSSQSGYLFVFTPAAEFFTDSELEPSLPE